MLIFADAACYVRQLPFRFHAAAAALRRLPLRQMLLLLSATPLCRADATLPR